MTARRPFTLRLSDRGTARLHRLAAAARRAEGENVTASEIARRMMAAGAPIVAAALAQPIDHPDDTVPPGGSR